MTHKLIAAFGKAGTTNGETLNMLPDTRHVEQTTNTGSNCAIGSEV